MCDTVGESPLDLAPTGPMRDLLHSYLPRRYCDSPMSAPVQSHCHSDFLPIGLLGKGEFGEVYLVQHSASGVKYAMKTVRKSRSAVQLFKRERRVMETLDHPFVMKLHWAFQTDTHLCLVVDYCPRGDLSDFLRVQKPLCEDVARFYACEIVLALECLHDNNIIYRHLKPENLVFDFSGHVRLTDFDLSKMDMKLSALTSTVCGPLAYSPPEMVREQPHGYAADWYMLGCLLYEMLVGFPPFHSREQWKLFQKIESGKVEYPDLVSDEAKDLMQRLLHLDPAQRLGRNGAWEIKTHQFFEDVDWCEYLSKSIRVPVLPPLKTPKRMASKRWHATQSNGNTKVLGWSFCRED